MHPEFCGSEVCVLQDSFTCKQQKAQLQFSSAGGAGGQGLWALGRGQAPYVRAARTPSRGSLGFVLLPVAAAALLSGREGPGAPRRGRGPGCGASGVGGQGVRPASLPAGLALPRCSRGRWLGVRCAEPRAARVWTRQRRAGRREPPSPRPHEPETCPSGRRVPFAGIFLFLLCAESFSGDFFSFCAFCDPGPQKAINSSYSRSEGILQGLVVPCKGFSNFSRKLGRNCF